MTERDLARWTPRPVPGNAPMAGRLVRIEALEPERHWRDLWSAFGGPGQDNLWRYMAIGPFQDERGFRAGLDSILGRRPDWIPFAILDAGNGRACGIACYLRIDAANGSAEVGSIVYGARLSRRPGATEAMLLMGRRIFEELGYRRYEWKCDALNALSRSAALRLGFTFEGVFRQHMVVKGRNRDTAWSAILDSEWPRIAAAMERWLSPDNFDSAGRQRQRLKDVLAANG